MLTGTEILKELAQTEHTNLKPFSAHLTSQLLTLFSATDKFAFAALLLQTEFNLKKDIKTVARNPEMFSRIYLTALFDSLNFPFNHDYLPQDQLRDLILKASTDESAVEKLKGWLASPSRIIVNILLPVYHDYLEHKGYNLHLMSDKPELITAGNLYIGKKKKQLQYLVSDSEFGKYYEGLLDIKVTELNSASLEQLKSQILEETTKRGHTYAKTPEQYAKSLCDQIGFNFLESQAPALGKDPQEIAKIAKTLRDLYKNKGLLQPLQDAILKAHETFEAPLVMSADGWTQLKDLYLTCQSTHEEKFNDLLEKARIDYWRQYCLQFSEGSQYNKLFTKLVGDIQTIVQGVLKNISNTNIVITEDYIDKTVQQGVTEVVKLNQQGEKWKTQLDQHVLPFIHRVNELCEICQELNKDFPQGSERALEFESLRQKIKATYTQLETALFQPKLPPIGQAVQQAELALTTIVKDHINKVIATKTPLIRITEHLGRDLNEKQRLAVLLKRLIVEGADTEVKTDQYKKTPSKKEGIYNAYPTSPRNTARTAAEIAELNGEDASIIALLSNKEETELASSMAKLSVKKK